MDQILVDLGPDTDVDLYDEAFTFLILKNRLKCEIDVIPFVYVGHEVASVHIVLVDEVEHFEEPLNNINVSFTKILINFDEFYVVLDFLLNLILLFEVDEIKQDLLHLPLLLVNQ